MIEWRRHRGGRRTAHAFENVEGLCGAAKAPVGSRTSWGFGTTPLDPVSSADLGPFGTPYGTVCTRCARIVREGGRGGPVRPAGWYT